MLLNDNNLAPVAIGALSWSLQHRSIAMEQKSELLLHSMMQQIRRTGEILSRVTELLSKPTFVSSLRDAQQQMEMEMEMYESSEKITH